MARQKGFTLIELLLVLAIIGIISAIAVPALLGQRARARDKAALQNGVGILADFVAAVDSLGDETGTDPTVAAFQAMTIANIPAFTGSRNPWSSPAPGFNQTVYTESSNTCPQSLAGAVLATRGQVQVGYFYAPIGHNSAVGFAVYLNAIPPGSTTNVYQQVAGLD